MLNSCPGIVQRGQPRAIHRLTHRLVGVGPGVVQRAVTYFHGAGSCSALLPPQRVAGSCSASARWSPDRAASGAARRPLIGYGARTPDPRLRSAARAICGPFLRQPTEGRERWKPIGTRRCRRLGSRRRGPQRRGTPKGNSMTRCARCSHPRQDGRCCRSLAPGVLQRFTLLPGVLQRAFQLRTSQAGANRDSTSECAAARAAAPNRSRSTPPTPADTRPKRASTPAGTLCESPARLGPYRQC